jgi:hypothetical protein
MVTSLPHFSFQETYGTIVGGNGKFETNPIATPHENHKHLN